MVMGWLNKETNEYNWGDQQAGEISYPPPPSRDHVPDGAGGWVVPIDVAKSKQISIIDKSYVDAVQISVEFSTAAGVAKTFQADNQGPLSSQDVLLKAFTGYNIAGATPNEFTWRAEDNTEVPFTLADLAGLYQEMLSQGDAAFRKRTALKAQIAAASTVMTVQAITW
jgi:hypothetical protein